MAAFGGRADTQSRSSGVGELRTLNLGNDVKAKVATGTTGDTSIGAFYQTD